jgi:hypothetical protein
MLKSVLQNSKFIISVFTAVLVLVLVLAVFGSHTNIIQPIEYNHNIHIEVAGLSCIDCHINVETKPIATIPNIEICQDCHSDEPISESPEEEKLLKYISEGNRIPWKQIYKVPDHVYFSHQRHVTIGELECSLCHGKVEEMIKPASYPVWIPTMENCISCHKENKVTTDCLACHR